MCEGLVTGEEASGKRGSLALLGAELRDKGPPSRGHGACALQLVLAAHVAPRAPILFCSGSSSAVGILGREFSLKQGVGRLFSFRTQTGRHVEQATDSRKHNKEPRWRWVEGCYSWFACESRAQSDGLCEGHGLLKGRRNRLFTAV